MTIGERIKFHRKAQGLTLQAVEDICGLARSTVRKIEAGETIGYSKNLAKIADALNVPLEALTGEGDEVFKVVLDKNAYMPQKAHKSDTGFDLRSPKMDMIPAHGSVNIDTGVHLIIPEDAPYCALLVSKSGLNVKHGITSTGLLDAGYTGSITVKLYNNSDTSYIIERGDKISQLIILPVPQFTLCLDDVLPETERGEDGFGSTGK